MKTTPLFHLIGKSQNSSELLMISLTLDNATKQWPSGLGTKTSCQKCVLCPVHLLLLLQERFFSSHGILPCPFPSHVIVLGHVRFVNASYLWHEWIIWVGVAKQRTNWQQHLRHCQRWWPLWPEYVQTNCPIRVYVWMIYPCSECKFWRLEGIVSWKVNVEEENSSFIGWFTRSKNCCLPMKRIISNGSCGTLSWWIIADVFQFFVYSLESHLPSALYWSESQLTKKRFTKSLILL